jgi:hypothetical protein
METEPIDRMLKIQPTEGETPSPTELREKLLRRAAPLLDQYIDAALGYDTIESIDPHFREQVWGMIKKFIESADNKLYLPEELRGDPTNILKAVETGYITIEEGERLLMMYRVIKQIECEGQSPDTVNQTYIPHITINTLPPGEDEDD